MDLRNFRFIIDADGVALLTWDMSERSMNVITAQVMDELEAIIAKVSSDDAVKGCVITSGKETFSGGADLGMLEEGARLFAKAVREQGEERAMEAFFERSRRLSLIYRRMETCGKPFVAAINGLCLGGAFELALACHHRILVDEERARVGLPEIKVGLFPGAGGTQRVARLMPTGDALQMLLKGDQIRPRAAKAMNLVNALAPRETLVEEARAWILGGGKGVAPWDAEGFRLPSGKVYSPGGMMIWPAANAIYRRETFDNYPAAKAMLHSVFEGLQLPMDLALRVESRWFAKILRSPQAAAMIRTLFVSMGELNKGARRPAAEPASHLRKVGVIGAGFMGSGIAYVCALAGLDVVLIDRDAETAEKGKAYSHKSMTGQIAKGRARTGDRDALMARIHATADYAQLRDCQLVIEAVFEDRQVKAETTRLAESHMADGAVFASNTSTLPISSLAKASARPRDFIGVHFFSPVEKMMLVEIIMGKETSPHALAVALDFVRAIKKTPIVVNDARGFYANRCVGNYLREGHLMLVEGVPPAMIETAARMAGMPVGPLALSDEVALDLIWKIMKATEKELGDESIDKRQANLIESMVVTHGRSGRKNGKGFYEYGERGQKQLWPGLSQLAPRADVTANIEELKERFLAAQALEAARTMEEGVVTDPREADVGSILGFGFAPWSGGTLSYIDGMGAKTFLDLCDRLAARHGARFTAPDLLREMAARDETFYGRFAARSEAA